MGVDKECTIIGRDVFGLVVLLFIVGFWGMSKEEHKNSAVNAAH